MIEELWPRPADSPSVYEAQLNRHRNRPNFLITTPPGPAEFEPRVTQAFAEAAAKRLGFTLLRTFDLPDGRSTKIWWADRGPRLAPGQRVSAGFLESTRLDLVRPGPGRTAGSRLVRGRLTRPGGQPLGGATIDLVLRPLDGPGVWGEYRRSGVVPQGASRALVGIRINAECGCRGLGDVLLRRAAYAERGAQASNEPPPVVLDGRAFTDDPSRLTFSHPGAPELDLRVDAGDPVLLNSAPFPARRGAPYEVRLLARVSPRSAGSGYFAVIFLDEREVLRETIPFDAAPLKEWTARTGPDGTFAVFLPDLGGGRYVLEATYAGDATYWPAQARRIVDP
jgi:hypothetical protein